MMRISTLLLKAALVAAFFMPAFSQALDMTVSVGDTYATHSGEGIWWQQPYPHKLPTNTPSVGVRVDTPSADGLSFGAGWRWVGNFRSDALALASDQAYAAGTPYPLSRWIGSEQVQALYGVARHTRGHWYVEEGVALVASRFSMVIPDWVNCTDRPACLTPAAAPQYLRVGAATQFKTAPIVGIGYHFDAHMGVDLTVWPTRISGEFPGITKGYSPTLSFNYTF